MCYFIQIDIWSKCSCWLFVIWYPKIPYIQARIAAERGGRSTMATAKSMTVKGLGELTLYSQKMITMLTESAPAAGAQDVQLCSHALRRNLFIKSESFDLDCRNNVMGR